MIQPVKTISNGYRIFCRAACGALLLNGVFLIVFSMRTAQFTCQRSDGQCAITHLGMLAGPDRTFALDNVRLVQFADDGMHSDSWIYRLTVRLATGERWPIQYSWLSPGQIPTQPLDEINRFLRDPRIKELSVQVGDTRLNYLMLGIFCLAAGLTCTLTNLAAIRPAPPISPEPGPAACAEVPPSPEPKPGLTRKQWLRSDFIIFSAWVLAPVLTYQIISFLIEFVMFSTQNATGFRSPLFSYIFFFSPILFPFTAQAWVIRDVLNVNIKRWLACILGSLCVFVMLAIALMYSSMRRTDFSSLINAIDLGRLSPLGWLVGSVFGLFQGWALRQRLPHTEWWVLGSALAGLFAYSTVRLSRWLLALVGLDYVSPAGMFVNDNSLVISALVYLVMTGVVLVLLLKLRRWDDKRS